MSTDDPRWSNYERERGKPLPSTNHSIVQNNLVCLLSGNPGLCIHPEQNILINGKRWVPDVCVYPRWPVDWQHDVLDLTEMPLLIAEIFTPGQTPAELRQRADTYLAAGVPSVWIVMPPQGSITVQNADGSQTVHTSGKLKDPGTGLEVDLAEIFS